MEIYSVSLWHDSDNSDINVQPCSVEGMGDKYLLTACIGGWFNAHHPHPLPSLLSIKTHSPQCSTKQEVLWKMNSHAAVHNGVRAWTELWMIRGQVAPPPEVAALSLSCNFITDLSSHHLQSVCSTKRQPDIMHAVPFISSPAVFHPDSHHSLGMFQIVE